MTSHSAPEPSPSSYHNLIIAQNHANSFKHLFESALLGFACILLIVLVLVYGNKLRDRFLGPTFLTLERQRRLGLIPGHQTLARTALDRETVETLGKVYQYEGEHQDGEEASCKDGEVQRQPIGVNNGSKEASRQSTGSSSRGGGESSTRRKVRKPGDDKNADASMEEELADDVRDCTVCLLEYNQGDWLRQLDKCQHRFHKECIDPWLIEHGSCPLCRTSFLPEKEGEGEEEEHRGVEHQEPLSQEVPLRSGNRSFLPRIDQPPVGIQSTQGLEVSVNMQSGDH